MEQMNYCLIFNITSSDSIFNVKIGSPTQMLYLDLKKRRFPHTAIGIQGATIIDNRAPDKFVGAGSLTVAQNNWDLSSNNINYGREIQDKLKILLVIQSNIKQAYRLSMRIGLIIIFQLTLNLEKLKII